MASVYNFIWGTLVVVFPKFFFDLLAIRTPGQLVFWQTIGMFVLVYSPAYFWAGMHPKDHPHLIAIGFLGKLLGPIGFVHSYLNRDLPLQFGIINIFNDLIWLPVFALYLYDSIRVHGAKNLLSGKIKK